MSITIEKGNTTISTTPDNWAETNYSSADLWNAFQRGEQYQLDKQKSDFEETLKKNLNRAAFLSEGIFHTANNDYGVAIKRAYLKAESLQNYDVLFLVGANDFISDKIKDIYKRSHLVKSEFNEDEFHISFKFMPISEHLNVECIYSDGYMLEYGKDKQEA